MQSTTKKTKTTTTLVSRKTANPRRTTLAHLESAQALRALEPREHAVELPAVTANPRRTVLMTAPVAAPQG
ncbi:hypothetical protein AB0H73_02815 [Streptomyces olivoreticuli]|uniref:hypothetical protein n=1 Tax=Streptomyces olivoreticuli TaxID=68246 RepID=UPI000E249D7C|nr:hypothetical protein [Streptomyces olivoreticuli]